MVGISQRKNLGSQEVVGPLSSITLVKSAVRPSFFVFVLFLNPIFTLLAKDINPYFY